MIHYHQTSNADNPAAEDERGGAAAACDGDKSEEGNACSKASIAALHSWWESQIEYESDSFDE